MNIFISQPMNGKSEEEFDFVRRAILSDIECRYEDFDIIGSFFETGTEDDNHVWMLGYAIMQLSKADAVYFADGWENYRGCRIEYEIAKDYGIEIIHE